MIAASLELVMSLPASLPPFLVPIILPLPEAGFPFPSPRLSSPSRSQGKHHYWAFRSLFPHFPARQDELNLVKSFMNDDNYFEQVGIFMVVM